MVDHIGSWEHQEVPKGIQHMAEKEIVAQRPSGKGQEEDIDHLIERLNPCRKGCDD